MALMIIKWDSVAQHIKKEKLIPNDLPSTAACKLHCFDTSYNMYWNNKFICVLEKWENQISKKCLLYVSNPFFHSDMPPYTSLEKFQFSSCGMDIAHLQKHLCQTCQKLTTMLQCNEKLIWLAYHLEVCYDWVSIVQSVHLNKHWLIFFTWCD